MNSNITTRSSTKIVKKLFKDKEIIVTEIGVLGGKNTFDMLCELNISEFYAIDPYVVFDDISS